MRKKIKKVIPPAKKVIPKENLLGFESADDLYKQLLEKSKFVFPEYKNVVARRCISKHTADLIASGLYSGKRLVKLEYSRNIRLIKHLEQLAKKGFAFYTRKQHKGMFKLNIERIKTDWIDVDHQKTEAEFQNEAINRANAAVKNILSIARIYDYCEVASQLEFLQAVLEDLFLLNDEK